MRPVHNPYLTTFLPYFHKYSSTYFVVVAASKVDIIHITWFTLFAFFFFFFLCLFVWSYQCQWNTKPYLKMYLSYMWLLPFYICVCVFGMLLNYSFAVLLLSLYNFCGKANKKIVKSDVHIWFASSRLLVILFSSFSCAFTCFFVVCLFTSNLSV